MYLMREETGASLAEIGQHLGGRDHTTVLYGVERIAEMIEDDDADEDAAFARDGGVRLRRPFPGSVEHRRAVHLPHQEEPAAPVEGGADPGPPLLPALARLRSPSLLEAVNEPGEGGERGDRSEEDTHPPILLAVRGGLH